MRNHLIPILACTLALAGLASPATAAPLETFEQGNAGWTVLTIRDAGRASSSPAGFQASGGNPAGHVSAPLGGGPSRLYAVQPPSGKESRYGDLTGKTLAVDYRLDGSVAGGSRDRKIRFFIGYADPGGADRYWVSDGSSSWSPDTAGQWTTLRVPLDKGRFIPWQGQAAREMSFEEVLKRYNDVGLVFVGDPGDRRDQGLSGRGMVRVDNFGVSPGSVALPEDTVERSQRPASRSSGPADLPPEFGDFGLSPEALLPMALQLGGYLFVAGLATGLLSYLVFALFLYLIARKLSVPGAWTAWVPIVQVYTMVAAAGKPWWWTVLLLVPLLSWVPFLGLAAALFTIVDLVLLVLIWMAVCRRLRENKWLGILFLVPIVQWLLMGYLALKREPQPPPYSPARVLITTGVVFVLIVAALWALVTFLVLPGLNAFSPAGTPGGGSSPSVTMGVQPVGEEPEISGLNEGDYRALLDGSEVPEPSAADAAAAGPAKIYPDHFWEDEKAPHVWVKVRLPDLPNLHLFESGRVVVTSVRTAAGGNAYNGDSNLEKDFFQKADFKRQAGPPPYLEALRDVQLVPGTSEGDLKAMEGEVRLRLPVGVKTLTLGKGDEGRTVNLNGTDVTLEKMEEATARLKIESRPDLFLTALAYFGDRPVGIAGHASWDQENAAGVQYQFGGKADRIKVVVAEEILELAYPFSMSF